MKTALDCIPCFTRQALDAARMVSGDVSVHEEVARRVLALAARMDFAQPPPVVGQEIHRIIRRITGVVDPYHDVKERFTRFALTLYPSLKERVRRSSDRLETAVRLAIAGNVIDLGVESEISEEDIERAIEEMLSARIRGPAFGQFRERAAAASDIFYIADNAGEIIFDRLLIEELLPTPVTVVVRGHPVINDATRADAETAGLDGLAEIMDNGSDAPGTVLTDISPECRRRFDRADLVVAKGQGNYETLSEVDREVFFLLRAKCPVIADDIGCETGSIVVERRGAERRRVAGPVEGV